MCCFSRPVPHVSATNIFARPLEGGRQALVYQMSVEVPEDLAMVLPLPVPPAPPEDAVHFVDLSAYPAFFDDLAAAFPPVMQPAARMAFGPPPAAAAPVLKVHDVGDFEASFVPQRSDFSRLDPRFRMPDGVWDELPEVADFGFAVFKLKPKKGLFGAKSGEQRVHPMALTFPRRDERAIYFPTLHVHDGTVARSAQFDHALYCQPTELIAHLFAWGPSHAPIGTRVDASRARGLIDGAAYAFRQVAMGVIANEDVWLREPVGVTVDDLTPKGESFTARVAATTGFGVPLPLDDAPFTLRAAAWRATARDRLAALCRGLREGLVAFEQSRGRELGLGPLHFQLPHYFMNGPQLWKGTSYLDGKPAEGGGGAGRITFSPFTDRVETQSVTLGFARVPDARGIELIQSELRRILDAAVADG